METNLVDKLEIHYFFEDASHTIDAFVRNKCETEILSIIKEVIILFDSSIQIETEPYLNGGFKQVWKLLGKNDTQITIILAAVAIIVSIWPKSTSDLDNLQEEHLRLQIEKDKLELKQLKELNRDHSNHSNSKALVDTVVKINSSNLKVVKHRSNFYSQLNSYPKITYLSTTVLYNDYRIFEDSKMVVKDDFSKFILESDELPAVIDENAGIVIISPVLKKGKYKWKGIYNNEPIEFYMKDNKFKDSINNQEITFKNGVSIDCLLEINKKINETGNVQIVSYNVITVRAITERDIIKETPQGKEYRRRGEAEKLQLKLPLE